MAPAVNISFTADPLAIADGQIHNLKIVFSSPENQIEISERIHFTKVRSVGRDHLIVPLAESLGAAQRVFDALAQQPGEGQTEEAISNEIEKAHSAFFHRVHQTYAVYELSFSRAPGLVKARQIFRRHSEVRVQNH